MVSMRLSMPQEVQGVSPTKSYWRVPISPAIVTGLNQQNTLTVIARGNSIYLYINKQYVTTLTDSSSTIGAIGMLAGSSAGGTSNVTYSDAQVWTL